MGVILHRAVVVDEHHRPAVRRLRGRRVLVVAPVIRFVVGIVDVVGRFVGVRREAPETAGQSGEGRSTQPEYRPTGG
ncbi:hypothetical protein C497_05532 [Halalkalicoccus jeotgali B3]|uniref:Uncharacterized protein n=1 Tax=Halalkalicoccus jeotgali (strain DSM 18796 / CECT 7217 / JCM 14584 / KCTC 4019 / B3) TaxID=795797 RepID=L9VQF3_HALJB|nr:hypothetical protein C497_05532 [Halalkalicoccus jeotgali B3]